MLKYLENSVAFSKQSYALGSSFKLHHLAIYNFMFILLCVLTGFLAL